MAKKKPGRPRSRKKYPAKSTLEKREKFLVFLSESTGGNITKAAELAGINKKLLYEQRSESPDFAARWDHARQIGFQALEDEAIRRAYEGTEKPITIAGQREVIREYSDKLLVVLLNRAFPDKYVYRSHHRTEISGADGQPVEVKIDARTALLQDPDYLEYLRQRKGSSDNGHSQRIVGNSGGGRASKKKRS